jgi:hypothetical protein
MNFNNSNINSINDSADFWHYQIGVNVIPADTKNKQTGYNWSQCQEKPIPNEFHEQRKRNGEYNKGIALVTGKIWRGQFKGKYLVAIDLDNKKAIEEFCKNGLEELKLKTLVEQTSNPEKMHLYFIVEREIPNKTSDKCNTGILKKINTNEIPALEVKSNGKGIMFCSNSPHQKDGYYHLISTLIPEVFKAQNVEDRIKGICNKYNIPYGFNSNNSTGYLNTTIEDLWKTETVILEGHNRHLELLRIMESELQRNRGIKPLEDIKQIVQFWNQKHCKPPLDEKEFEIQWNDALKFLEKNKDENTNSKDNVGKNSLEITFVESVRQNCLELFVDQYNVPYVSIELKGHNEILGIDSQRFKNWLYRFFYEKNGEINSEQIENTIKILKSEAEFSGVRKRLELRVAKAETDAFTFFYDLTDSNWTAVKITPQGWTIENNLPIIFRRYNNQLPQVIPNSSQSSFLTMDDKDDTILDKFIRLLNVKDDDNKLLLKCYIISLFIPEIAKPILMLHGEQGSAKTTLQELIKMLVDPSIVKTLTFPRNINELVQQLSHNYIAYYDNISVIKEQISDALCRAVTGTGFSKRKLYTDDDDIIYNFIRCIGFNGINLAATKADLLDRGIIIQLERIPKNNRRKIEDIWNDFEILRPQLLAYIFDILVKVLQVKQNGEIKISNGLNRMADFEEYAEIISKCMGYKEGEFLRVYQDNIGVQIDEAIQSSSLSMALIELMDNNNEGNDILIDTASELLLKLNDIAETKLKIDFKKISSWPKSPNQLSRKLNEAQTNLRERGIIIERFKDEKSHRKIKIRKVSSKSSYRQEFEKEEQNPDKSLDDTLDDINKVSSNNNNKNQEQNNSFARFDGVDDDLHIKVKEHFAKGKSLKCYDKNCNDKDFHSLESYNQHHHSKHPKQPMYPELSLIKMLGLEAKGNPWE